LFNYLLVYPDLFNYRALTRLTGVERQFTESIWKIFFYNFGNAATMFFWDNGKTWVHSVLYRPALDFVSGAIYFVGIVFMIFRYFQKRKWSDLALLLSIPLLMMPSILSIAFPEENPSLNRTAGAIVPVFIVMAIGLYGIFSSLWNLEGSRSLGRKTACGIGLVLVLIIGSQNYSLIFDTYKTQFDASDWNTSQIGHVIKGYADSVGSEDTAYVIPYPYWVDTRLVGINAGFPKRDYALAYEYLGDTLKEPRNKLFIFYHKDEKSRATLEQMYPEGVLSLYPSGFDGKDFFVYLVPGNQ
jgi:hypothetical protein